MAQVHLTIQGSLGIISLRTLVAALESELQMLRDLDAGISGEKRGTLDWVVSKVEDGSIEVGVESHSRIEGTDLGQQVATTMVRNLADIELGRATPVFLSERGIKAAKTMVNTIGRDGAVGLAVSTPALDPVELTASAAVNVRALTAVWDRSIGSVEGRLEAISIHRGTRFTVYRSLNNRAVTCLFGRHKTIDEVTPFLGKRVHVSGVIYYNRFGDPFRMEVENIRRLRDRSELPSIAEITGMAPDFTAELSTEEYLQELRVG